MFSSATEGLLIAVCGAHLMVLFFIAWYAVYATLQIRRARRLAIGIAGGLVVKLLQNNGKMDCNEVIDVLLSAGDVTGTAVSEAHRRVGRAKKSPRRARPRAQQMCCNSQHAEAL